MPINPSVGAELRRRGVRPTMTNDNSMQSMTVVDSLPAQNEDFYNLLMNDTSIPHKVKVAILERYNAADPSRGDSIRALHQSIYDSGLGGALKDRLANMRTYQTEGPQNVARVPDPSRRKKRGGGRSDDPRVKKMPNPTPGPRDESMPRDGGSGPIIASGPKQMPNTDRGGSPPFNPDGPKVTTFPMPNPNPSGYRSWRDAGSPNNISSMPMPTIPDSQAPQPSYPSPAPNHPGPRPMGPKPPLPQAELPKPTQPNAPRPQKPGNNFPAELLAMLQSGSY